MITYINDPLQNIKLTKILEYINKEHFGLLKGNHLDNEGAIHIHRALRIARPGFNFQVQDRDYFLQSLFLLEYVNCSYTLHLFAMILPGPISQRSVDRNCALLPLSKSVDI